MDGCIRLGKVRYLARYIWQVYLAGIFGRYVWQVGRGSLSTVYSTLNQPAHISWRDLDIFLGLEGGQNGFLRRRLRLTQIGM